MIMDSSLVSVVIPVRNRPVLIRECVQSVVSQLYRPIEIVIVDDASSDTTPRVIEELQRAHGDFIRPIRRIVAGGPGAAREDGRRMIRGGFVQYLDSDDLLHPTKLKRQVEQLNARPQAYMSCGATEIRIADQRRHEWRTVRRAPASGIPFPSMLMRRPWHTFAPLYRRTAVERGGAWLPLYNEEDWEYDARLAAWGDPVASLDDVVGIVRRSSGGNLTHGGRGIRRRLASQACARPRVMRHGLRAGVSVEAPEFQHAVRALFLLARQCAAAGLLDAASKLMQHVEVWCERSRLPSLRAYKVAGRLLGVRGAGVLARSLDTVKAAWRA